MRPFYILMIVIKYVSFTASPIDGKRFRSDLRRKISMKEKRLASLNDEKIINKELEAYQRQVKVSNLFVANKNPSQILRAIKRYHQVGNLFLVSSVLHYLVLLYLISKQVFHMLMSGKDKELALYFERNFFIPRLFESHKTPEIFYSHTLGICLFCLISRLICSSRLVQGALHNHHYYEKINLTQVMTGNFCYVELPFKDWLRLLRAGIDYWSRVKRNGKKALVSYLVTDKQILDYTDKTNTTGLIYHVNLIDFSECYHEIGKSLSMPGGLMFPDMRRSHLWHLTLPPHRLDPGSHAFIIVALALSVVTGILFLVAVFLFTLHFELDGAINEIHGHRASFSEISAIIPSYFSNSRRCLRLFDLVIFGWIQVPPQLDAVLFYGDAGVLISRAQKVLKCFSVELDLCLRGRASQFHDIVSSLDRPEFRDGRDSLQLDWTLYYPRPTDNLDFEFGHRHPRLAPRAGTMRLENGRSKSPDCLWFDSPKQMYANGIGDQLSGRGSLLLGRETLAGRRAISLNLLSSDRAEFSLETDLGPKQQAGINERLGRYIKMARVLQKEFVDLKHSHTIFVNVLILINGFCIAKCLSLILTDAPIATQLAISINCVALIVPIVAVIALSIQLDSLVSLYARGLLTIMFAENIFSYTDDNQLKMLLVVCFGAMIVQTNT